jgi:hypothetical protein
MKNKKISFIYSNLYIYRFAVNLLRGFKYKERFAKVIKLISQEDKIVVELCFGDIYIAKYCRKENKKWIGFDLNDVFVNFAKKRGYDARLEDIALMKELPETDICVMMGSLYHFNYDLKRLFEKIRQSSRRFILSEPVINLTDSKGVIGKISSKLTNAGKGEENFRFNEKTLLEKIEFLKNDFKFNYKVVDKDKDMIIEINWQK